MNLKPLLSSLAIGAAVISSMAATNDLKVNVGKPGAPIQPTMYGIFFEDINYAADGGLYAEKIINRSFEFPQPLMGWRASGSVEVRTDGAPFDRAPHYVRLAPSGHPHKHTAIENEGFFGVSVERGKEYRLSLWGRADGNDTARIRVEIADPASMGETHTLAKADIRILPGEWRRYEVMLKPSKSVERGRLRIFLVHPDHAVDLEHISLMPTDTWKGRRNGLRADLVEKLADLRPGVFRFPGGCIVEGTDLASRYQWKNTVGPVENRPVNENRWH
ncbi:MAG: carbohydrate binding domain-containing protein, partial [Duncaniella sp.]|nr:carbohydrate binding domain-containing protein [Duncaniella sp.]